MPIGAEATLYPASAIATSAALHCPCRAPTATAATTMRKLAPERDYYVSRDFSFELWSASRLPTFHWVVTDVFVIVPLSAMGLGKLKTLKNSFTYVKFTKHAKLNKHIIANPFEYENSNCIRLCVCF